MSVSVASTPRSIGGSASVVSSNTPEKKTQLQLAMDLPESPYKAAYVENVAASILQNSLRSLFSKQIEKEEKRKALKALSEGGLAPGEVHQVMSTVSLKVFNTLNLPKGPLTTKFLEGKANIVLQKWLRGFLARKKARARREHKRQVESGEYERGLTPLVDPADFEPIYPSQEDLAYAMSRKLPPVATRKKEISTLMDNLTRGPVEPPQQPGPPPAILDSEGTFKGAQIVVDRCKRAMSRAEVGDMSELQALAGQAELGSQTRLRARSRSPMMDRPSSPFGDDNNLTPRHSPRGAFEERPGGRGGDERESPPRSPPPRSPTQQSPPRSPRSPPGTRTIHSLKKEMEASRPYLHPKEVEISREEWARRPSMSPKDMKAHLNKARSGSFTSLPSLSIPPHTQPIASRTWAVDFNDEYVDDHGDDSGALTPGSQEIAGVTANSVDAEGVQDHDEDYGAPHPESHEIAGVTADGVGAQGGRPISPPQHLPSFNDRKALKERMEKSRPYLHPEQQSGAADEFALRPVKNVKELKRSMSRSMTERPNFDSPPLSPSLATSPPSVAEHATAEGVKYAGELPMANGEPPATTPLPSAAASASSNSPPFYTPASAPMPKAAEGVKKFSQLRTRLNSAAVNEVATDEAKKMAAIMGVINKKESGDANDNSRRIMLAVDQLKNLKRQLSVSSHTGEMYAEHLTRL